MIVVTGAAGFIGSCLSKHLFEIGYKDLVLVDDFSRSDKANNLLRLDNAVKVTREDFISWLDDNYIEVEIILHIGARTDTTEFNRQIFDSLNLNYTKNIWNKCIEYGLPLIYASSAATYGDGSLGYEDNHDIVEKLEPLNPYGESKNEFDKWALKQKRAPYFWVGLKFFNVYGPNEYHKSRMASVVFHAFNQVKENGKVKLFRSHRADYTDGGQKRDFIYVKDVLNVIVWFLKDRKAEKNGLYNLGTGKAETFLELGDAVFRALGKESNIEFIDTPIDIRDKYQYFTEANMAKLRAAGYEKPFSNLAQGVNDYVKNYLERNFAPF